MARSRGVAQAGVTAGCSNRALKGATVRGLLLSGVAPAAIFLTAACASAPPLPPKPPAPSFDQKMSWILRLEDHRVLRDPAPPVAPAPPPVKGKKAPVIALPPPPPDLIPLLSDDEARVRRRAALAVGHVGLREGVQPLVPLLTDAEPEVRQMAAFALGLIGDRSAEPALTTALGDQSPLVQGSAAEALGLIGDPASAPAVGKLVSDQIASGALAQIPGPDDDARRDTPAAACRLGIYALVRLKAFPQLASAVLDDRGQPKIRWWPVAYALGRLEDKRATAALVAFVGDPNPYARGFAVKGLGALKERSAVPVLLPLVAGNDHALAIEAIRALGRIGDEAAAAPLLKIVQAEKPDPQLRLEALTALGSLHAAGVQDALLDALGDPSPSVRSAALRSAARFDPDEFMTVLSGLDPDRQWTARAALADALSSLQPAAATPRLTVMLADDDQRVIPSVLRALVKLRLPTAPTVLLERLKADDPVVRASAAEGLGELKPPNGASALADAYRLGQRDSTYVARAAALAAAAKYGLADAKPILTDALADKDWAVRVRAAALLKELDRSVEVDAQIRPAPTNTPAEAYQSAKVVDPPVSTELFIDTDRGTIQIELAVLDAPLTVQNFVALARNGFFNGLTIHRVVPDFVVQDGDPRGDGEGGPGYTIRDELNERPYLRGTVGMALDWADTGGSQFFITCSPQPHLDARYTVFGRVTGGMEVVDQIQVGDVIRRIRVWDGPK